MKNKSLIAVLGVSACLMATPNIVAAEEVTDVVTTSCEQSVEESIQEESTEVADMSVELTEAEATEVVDESVEVAEAEVETEAEAEEDDQNDPTMALVNEIEEYNKRLPKGYKAVDIHGIVYLISPDGEQVPYAYYASCLGAGKTIEDAFAHCDDDEVEDNQPAEEANGELDAVVCDDADAEASVEDADVLEEIDPVEEANDEDVIGINNIEENAPEDTLDEAVVKPEDEDLRHNESQDTNIEGKDDKNVVNYEATYNKPTVGIIEKVENVLEQKAEEIETVNPEDIKPIFSHGYRFTGDEIYKLAQLMLHEAKNQCINGKIAIVEVVINRMKSDDFPSTVEEVIYQPSQFSGAKSSKYIVPTASDITLVEDVLLGKIGALHDSDILYFKNTSTCNGIKASTQRNWGDLKWTTYIQDHAFYSAK